MKENSQMSDINASKTPPVFEVNRYKSDELILNEQMNTKTIKNPTKSYQTTSDDQRFNFIEKIVNKELTIREAANLYGIRYSTGKTIMKVFKTEGRFEKKKQRLKKGSKKPNLTTQSTNLSLPSPILNASPPLFMRSPSILPVFFWADRITEHLSGNNGK